MKKVDFDKKWAELLQYAMENTTRQGMHTGIKWLQDAFNDYLKQSDSTPGYGMGGQSGSVHNREVLAEKICLELGNHVGGRHLLDVAQEAKLRSTLAEIVADQCRNHGLKR